ncbi:sensor histidine kinase [Bacillus sp. Gen3]|nr:sensor histidine kinase [Bacillus sp. Gen3]
MKLFLKDHLFLIVFNIIQLLLIISIYWLNGNHDLSIALYSLFFGGCLLIAYLLFRFFTHFSFYKKLSKQEPMHTLEETVHGKEIFAVPVALQEVLQNQYQQYKQDIHRYEYQQRNHRTFTNQWVHQMKTPISVIHLLLKGKIEPIFDDIHDQVDRIEKGLEMILYMSRLDSFEPDFHIESVDLKKLVSEVVHENKRLLIRNEVYPVIEISETMEVLTDAKWLRFILNQLLTNAVRYSAGYGNSVVIAAVKKGTERIIEVRDQGVGIPKQDIERVFEPYYTGENGRKYKESTGMGLYLTAEICKQLGHDISLKSVVNKGTTVSLSFRNLQ